MTPEHTFSSDCTRAAKAFIRTVMILDDDAGVDPDYSPASVGEIEPPGVDALLPAVPPGENSIGGSPSVAPWESPSARTETDSHRLDRQGIADAFAQQGVVCSVLIAKRQRSEDLAFDGAMDTAIVNRMLGLACNCDVVLLDWSWSGDPGTFCTKLIDALRRDARQLRRQVVIIYTASDDRSAFSARLAGLEGFHEVDSEHLRFQIGDRIDVFVLQKPGAATPLYDGSKVPSASLPERVFDRFGAAVGGLLANVAMHRLGAVRDESHAVLQQMRPEHDAPFVVHRAYTAPVSGAEDQVDDLIIDALGDTVRRHSHENGLNADAISRWVTARAGHLSSDARQVLTNGDYSSKASKATATKLHGLCNEVWSPRPSQSVSSENTAALGAPPSQGDGGALDRFHRFMHVVHEPIAPPKLQLGTIIASKGRLLLCVMPLCDTERIGEQGQAFVFVDVVSEPGSLTATRFAIRQHDDPSLISTHHVVTKLANARVLTFKPTKNDTPVLAVQSGTGWTFSSTENGGEEWIYVDRLRPSFAQAIAANFAASAGRVGVMTSEFLRRGN